MAFNFFGIDFHLYGLIIGIAILVAYQLSSHILKKTNYAQNEFDSLTIVTLISAVFGARIWHVFTDYHLYNQNILSALYFWQGGLSIIGAIVGIIIGIYLWQHYINKRNKQTISTLFFLDVLSFGLPFGQAIGRLGNYVNQELYGAPTNLPWAIQIDITHRLPGYLTTATYHPLFAYELILTTVGGLLVWFLYKNNQEKLQNSSKFLKLGSGNYFTLYALYYSAIRFFLDFLRIDKATTHFFNLGINQITLILLSIVCALYLRKNLSQSNQK